jgi:DNA repair protein RecN (Recombination protein N)
MIERFYMRSCLSFEEVELELDPGLIVFSGPSGSGKSLLMRSILGSVGLDDPIAEIGESTLSWQLDEDATGFVNEERNTFKQVKREKVRYFINDQSVSKRALKAITRQYLRHLSLKDYSDFEQESLLGLFDTYITVEFPEHLVTLETYRQEHAAYNKALHAMSELIDEEKRVIELREFAAFEVDKIDRIAPRIEEYGELMEVKKALSMKEKADEKIMAAESIFDNEYLVAEALQSLDIDPAFFDDAMNELRVRFDAARRSFDEIEEVDIEEVLDRLEQLSELNRRYGSIEEALEYRDKKASELERYENLDASKLALQKEIEKRDATLNGLMGQLSQRRREVLPALNRSLNDYLRQLYLDEAVLSLGKGEPGVMGQDVVELSLQGASLKEVSAGEFNRLRLALLAVKTQTMKSKGGVLMLDEIDANLSGEESMSVARFLRELSDHFQVFVVSHQPQLTAMGQQHFLVTKQGTSQALLLDDERRIDEIARMVSGETVTPEARELARELLESARCA